MYKDVTSEPYCKMHELGFVKELSQSRLILLPFDLEAKYMFEESGRI